VFRFTALLGLGSEECDKERDSLEPLEGLEVLVIEDNATQLETLGEMLKSWGLEPSLCSDAAAAFDVLERKEEIGEGVKLMIVDRVLGEEDGIELATRIQASSRWKSLPMILLTSVSDGSPGKEFNEVGISKVVNKPIKQSPLLDAVMLATGLGTRKPQKGRRESRGRERAVESMSILLAEDGKVNQLVAVRLLERRGHRVTVVENGKEAVDQSFKQQFDVILMDIQMPVMGGYEACREIRELEKKTGSRVAIVAMTAHAMPGDREECLEVGMDDYISKPIESEEFYEVIERFGSLGSGGEEIATTARGDLDEKSDPQGGEKEFDKAIFDAEAFSQRIGDEALMRELILIFEEEMEAMWVSLQEAEERQDMKTIYESAHRLKGLVGNFCARRAWEYATKLNDRAKKGSHSDDVSESVEGFERELRLLESSLCDFRENLENKANSL
jgi:CheY-like chemotaxis protein